MNMSFASMVGASAREEGLSSGAWLRRLFPELTTCPLCGAERVFRVEVICSSGRVVAEELQAVCYNCLDMECLNTSH